MSFTVANVQTKALSLCGETIADTDAPGWCWDALMRMDSRLWPETSDTTTYAAATADTWIALPATFVSVVEVLDSDGDEYTDYDIRSGKIRFEDAGAYTLNYRATPTALTATTGATGTVSLSDLLQEPMGMFLAFKHFEKNGDTAQAAKWEANFEKRMVQIAGILELDNAPLHVKEVW